MRFTNETAARCSVERSLQRFLEPRAMARHARGFPDVRRRPEPDHDRMFALLTLAATGMLLPVLILWAADQRRTTTP